MAFQKMYPFAPIAKDNGHTFLNPPGIEAMKYFA
jgi:hypothetical protein